MGKGYKDLEVWRQTVDLVEQIYQITKSFPKEELFGLTSQMRRAAISMVSNISEGAGRGSRKEFIQFLSVAYGSCCELEAQCIISERLKFISAQDASILAASIAGIGRMIKALQKSLKPPSN